jgi:DNA-binding SARP family transcriptional activator
LAPTFRHTALHEDVFESATRGGAVRVRLLGAPHIVSTRDVPQVRGFQVWAVLARVLLADRDLTRRELATELFPETSDPLGSLRWCLAAIRRALQAPDFLTGDPVRCHVPDHVSVDVLDLLAGRFEPAETGDLLEGVEPRSSVDGPCPRILDTGCV